MTFTTRYVQAVTGLILVILDLRASCHPPALKNVFEFAPPQAEKKLPPRISAIFPPPSRFFFESAPTWFVFFFDLKK